MFVHEAPTAAEASDVVSSPTTRIRRMCRRMIWHFAVQCPGRCARSLGVRRRSTRCLFPSSSTPSLCACGLRTQTVLRADRLTVPRCPPPPCDIPSGCCFFTGPWTVTRSSPSHVASGRCVLSAAAAGALAGVVSAFAEPSGRCDGAVPDVAGCAVCAPAAPSSWRIGGCVGCCASRFTVFAVPTPPSSGRPQRAALRPPPPPPPRLRSSGKSSSTTLKGSAGGPWRAWTAKSSPRC